jgi:uncharacterized protein (TIGR00730 family)
MQRIAIFGGSKSGNKKIFSTASKELSKLLVNKGIGVVYGGTNIGLMGIVADEMVKRGGDVIGVIPNKIVKIKGEIAHKGLKKLYVVNSMHERKALMAKLSDAFIALPGGVGTLEEIFEALTWTTLKIHTKPCGVLNIDGFFNLLDGLLNNCVKYDFLSQKNKNLLIIDEDPKRLIKKIITCI